MVLECALEIPWKYAISVAYFCNQASFPSIALSANYLFLGEILFFSSSSDAILVTFKSSKSKCSEFKENIWM